MLSPVWIRNSVFTAIVALSLSAASPAQEPGQADFQRGYFLQMHERDFAGAAIAYEAVVDNAGAPDRLRAEAGTRLAECREDLATADFARLMPADVIAYAEISNPGGHLARLIEQMGLARTGARESGAGAPAAMQIAPGFYFPNDFAISPALIKSLERFRGMAVAVTQFDMHRGPEGVLVLHPGDADLLRGAVESAIQFMEPAEPVEGYRTYRIQGEAWACATSRVLLVARSREQLAQVAARLRNPRDADSLAGSKDFQENRADREGALFYAYVNGPKAAVQIRQHLHGPEAQMIAGFLDLEHLRSISLGARATQDGVQFQARLDLMEGHRNLAYGLIRTAPCSRTSLEFVPAGAAGVALLGLNPPSSSGASRSPGAGPVEGLSAMDIGREFFANLEEAALYVSPLTSPAERPQGPPIPDVGLVLIARDSVKSQALWAQLLALPSMFMPQLGAGMKEVTVEGVTANEYRFPEVPPILLARVEGRAVVIGTRGAVAASIRAGADREAIVNDPGFKSLLSRLTPSTSKAVLIHAGRAVETAATLAPAREAEKLRLAASILADLRLCIVTEEKPTQFAIRAEATGLPNVPEAVRKLAALMQPRQRSTQVAPPRPGNPPSAALPAPDPETLAKP